MRSDMQVLEQLLDMHVDVNMAYKDESTPLGCMLLTWAIHHERVYTRVVKLLTLSYASPCVLPAR
jgi:hypothetical protein